MLGLLCRNSWCQYWVMRECQRMHKNLGFCFSRILFCFCRNLGDVRMVYASWSEKRAPQGPVVHYMRTRAIKMHHFELYYSTI